MAKRKTEQQIVGFAEDLGKFLGEAEKRASSWLGQRKAILEQLTAVRDKAADLIQTMSGGENPFPWQKPKRGQPAGATKRGPGRPRKTRGPGRPKGGKMSAAGRAAISAAQKKRWAKIKAEKKK
jgi:hypothetical protein